MLGDFFARVVDSINGLSLNESQNKDSRVDRFKQNKELAGQAIDDSEKAEGALQAKELIRQEARLNQALRYRGNPRAAARREAAVRKQTAGVRQGLREVRVPFATKLFGAVAVVAIFLA